MKLSRLPFVCLFLMFAVLLSSSSFAQEFKIKQIPRPTQWDADGKPIEKADLEIIDPTIWIFKANPTISTFQDKNKVEYSTRIFLSVWNRGEKTYRFPTKIDGVGRVDFPPRVPGVPEGGYENTCVYDFCFIPAWQGVEATDDHPFVPYVWPESIFDVAELRPGEAVLLTYKTLIDAENLVPDKKVMFQLSCKHKGRYSFWDGRLESKIYSLDAISDIFEDPAK